MFSLVVPFHSDVDRLSEMLRTVGPNFTSNGIGEVLLCHNGDPLSKSDRELISTMENSLIKFLHTDIKGLGAGYRIGIRAAVQPYVVLSASDLPFGFSDVVNFKALNNGNSLQRIAIGSKAHPDSDLANYPRPRRFFSYAYFICRRMILGAHTPLDSQGTIILERKLAQEIESLCISNDYFFSTELCAFAQSRGINVTELPISIRPQAIEGSSSVRVIRDSIVLFKKLFGLRSRLKEESRRTKHTI